MKDFLIELISLVPRFVIFSYKLTKKTIKFIYKKSKGLFYLLLSWVKSITFKLKYKINTLAMNFKTFFKDREKFTYRNFCKSLKKWGPKLLRTIKGFRIRDVLTIFALYRLCVNKPYEAALSALYSAEYSPFFYFLFILICIALGFWILTAIILSIHYYFVVSRIYFLYFLIDGLSSNSLDFKSTLMFRFLLIFIIFILFLDLVACFLLLILCYYFYFMVVLYFNWLIVTFIVILIYIGGVTLFFFFYISLF